MKRKLFFAVAIPLFASLIIVSARAQPRAPSGPSLPNPSVSSDPYNRWECILDITTNSTRTAPTAAAMNVLKPAAYATTVNRLYPVLGAKNVLFRVAGADSSDSNAENAVATLTLWGFTSGTESTGEATNADGATLMASAVTLGSSVSTNYDPTGYDASALDWYKCDTWTTTPDSAGNELAPTVVYDGAGDNRWATRAVDPGGNEYLWINATAQSGLTNLRIYAKRVSGG